MVHAYEIYGIRLDAAHRGYSGGVAAAAAEARPAGRGGACVRGACGRDSPDCFVSSTHESTCSSAGVSGRPKGWLAAALKKMSTAVTNHRTGRSRGSTPPVAIPPKILLHSGANLAGGLVSRQGRSRPFHNFRRPLGSRPNAVVPAYLSWEIYEVCMHGSLAPPRSGGEPGALTSARSSAALERLCSASDTLIGV